MAKSHKVRKKVVSIKKPELPEEEIAQDLQDSYRALKAIATAHNLLDKGLYKHTEYQAVCDSMVFLRSLHSQVKERALAHPDVDKIPELLELKMKIKLAEMENKKFENLHTSNQSEKSNEPAKT